MKSKITKLLTGILLVLFINQLGERAFAKNSPDEENIKLEKIHNYFQNDSTEQLRGEIVAAEVIAIPKKTSINAVTVGTVGGIIVGVIIIAVSSRD